MTAKLSDDPRDKLNAALQHAYPDADDNLSAAYRAACEQWFAQLTEGERWILLTATVIYEKGDADRAAKIASRLPPAPVLPLP